MVSVFRGVVRIVVIAALVGMAAVVVAGPGRVKAALSQARSAINSTIDRAIDDPVALRAQLRQLEAEYPRRIEAVRHDLSELRAQKTELERDLAVSQRVVELADRDLEDLGGLLERAEQERVSRAGYTIVRVRFDGQTMDLDRAYARQNRISQQRSLYATRAAELERDLGYLRQQEDRLSELLERLETERAEFQAQLMQLDRQVDAIARNERMIEMMEKRQKTIDQSRSVFDLASLEQIRSRFAQVRSEQEARLRALVEAEQGTDYEQRAIRELTARGSVESFDRPLSPGAIEIGPEVIEVPAGQADGGAGEQMAARPR